MYTITQNTDSGQFETRRSTDTLDDYFERQVLAAHANDTTRKDPFEKVTASGWGAPMGRTDFGTAPAKGIRLVKARLNSGGYDQGGAYFGLGKPIYAAVDSAIPCRYCRYVRAGCREEAMQLLGLDSNQLLRA